jgi:hypothetical protein
MEETTPARPAAVLATLAPAVLAAGAGAWLVLVGEERWAGAATVLAGAAALAADVRIRRIGSARSTFAGSLAERAVDAVLLGALAWELMPTEPRAGVAALVALSAAFVATYVGAKATGLGFRIREPASLQPLRVAAVAAGLLAGAVEGGLWAAAAVSLGGLVAGSIQVAGQEEPA